MNQLTSIQKQAIYNITMLMMMVDGHIVAPEAEYWKKVGKLLNMSETEMHSAATMDRTAALTALRSMTARNKIIAIKIFAEMMMADGKVDAREKQLLDNLFDAINVQQATKQLEGLEKIEDIVAPYGR